jgi:hypothetical protein
MTDEITKSPEYAEARKNILAHLPADLILARYARAAGDEIRSGKLASKESSAALAANTFGFFLSGENRAHLTLPGSNLRAGAAREVLIEEEVRFPWSGGKHPWLDAVVITDNELIGIESKRYETFRDQKKVSLSDAYSRPVWGSNMGSFEVIRDALKSGAKKYKYLDAAQLVKHAFGLRTQANKTGKKARLIYLYAEPMAFPDGRAIAHSDIAAHRAEVADFAAAISNSDETAFHSLSYGRLLREWAASGNEALRHHAGAIRALDVGRRVD